MCTHYMNMAMGMYYINIIFFSVLIFFCIRGYQRDNLEFSANYLYKLYNVLQVGGTFILITTFQIISGEVRLENDKS